MTIRPSFSRTVKPKIALVGEYPTEDDMKLGIPFMGKPGDELMKILGEIGVARNQFYLTYLYKDLVVKKDAEAELCVSKTEADKQWSAAGFPGKYSVPPLKQGKYVKPQHLMAVPALAEEIKAAGCNLVVTMGPLAAWAMIGTGSIRKLRGTVAESIIVPGQKVLPTYSPAQVLKMWDLRVILKADMQKAMRQGQYPEIRRPSRKVWIEPTLDDLEEFFHRHIRPDSIIAGDVETAHRQITCIGFAPDNENALVIPFVDNRKPGNNYWATAEEETKAWQFVQRIMGGHWHKLFQNGLYDLQYIWKAHHIRPHNCTEDTMLLHHALQPEMEKGLGFLGSIYTDEPAWKLMYNRAKDTEKRDE